AVCDLTQKDSLSALDDWIPRALEITGDVPLYLVVNKKDLEAQRAISDEEIRQAAETFAAPYVLTSALTGEFVEDAFNALAIEMVTRAFRQEDTRAVERGLRQKALVLLDKRGSIGLKKQQFFEILRGVKVDELQAELDRRDRGRGDPICSRSERHRRSLRRRLGLRERRPRDRRETVGGSPRSGC